MHTRTATDLAPQDENAVPQPLTLTEEEIARNKPILLAALKSLDIATIDIEYEGAGDDGDVTTLKPTTESTELDATAEEALCQRLEATPVEIWTLRPGCLGWEPFHYEHGLQASSTNLMDALKDFAWAVLEFKAPGWEIDEGSTGKLTLLVEPGRVELQHWQRHSIYESHDL